MQAVVLISWKDSVSRLSIGSHLWLCKIGVALLPLLSLPPPDLLENSVTWNFIFPVLCGYVTGSCRDVDIFYVVGVNDLDKLMFCYSLLHNEYN